MVFHWPFDPLFPLSGFLVGLLIGQTGMGGGALMTPLLVLGFGVHPTTAVGTDLLYAAATKAAGTAAHGMKHTVEWAIVRRLALGSVPSTAATLLVLSRLDPTGHAGERTISLVLGILLILTAGSLLFRRYFVAWIGDRSAAMPARRIAALTVVTGGVLGVLVTLTSVGAGALGVSVLLVLYPRLRMARIVGSDIAHAVPLTLVAGIGHWWLGAVDWPMLGGLLSGSVPGIVLGSYLAAHLPEGILRVLLAVMLLIVGGRLVL